MKRTVEAYIEKLLYRFDSVAVPGFGVFEGHRVPARYVEKTSTFYPPKKEIRFRFEPETNDRLLIDLLSAAENISPEKAKSIVEETVAQWKRQLKETGVLETENIGRFLMIEGKLFYTAGKSYLAEAFGLEPFVKKTLPKEEIFIAPSPAREETTNHKPENTAETITPGEKEEEKTVQESLSVEFSLSASPQRHKSKSLPFWRYAAAAVIGGALFLSVYLNMRHTATGQNNEIPVYQATYELPGTFPAVQLKTEENTLQTNPDLGRATNPTSPSIAIIAGAFRLKSNAEKMQRRLASAGYPATIVGQNRKGYWLVAYQTFDRRDEAEEKLKEIKQKVNPSAWIKE